MSSGVCEADKDEGFENNEGVGSEGNVGGPNAGRMTSATGTPVMLYGAVWMTESCAAKMLSTEVVWRQA